MTSPHHPKCQHTCGPRPRRRSRPIGPLRCGAPVAASHKSEEQEIKEINQVLFFWLIITTAASSSSTFTTSFHLPFLAVDQQICGPLTLSLLARQAVCVTSSDNGTFTSLSPLRLLPLLLRLLLLHLPLFGFAASPCSPLRRLLLFPLPFLSPLVIHPSLPLLLLLYPLFFHPPCQPLSKIRRVKPFEGFPLS